MAEEMESAVRDIQGLKTGRLSIGSSTTPGEYILPWAIGRFRRSYPGIEVSLSISNTRSVVDRILARELDLGMAGAPVEYEGLASFSYVTDDIVIIAHPEHPVMRRSGLVPEDLDGQEFILREPGSATRATAEQCLEEHGVSVSVVMELGSNEAVKRAVAAGLGPGHDLEVRHEPRYGRRLHRGRTRRRLGVPQASVGLLPGGQAPPRCAERLSGVPP